MALVSLASLLLRGEEAMPQTRYMRKLAISCHTNCGQITHDQEVKLMLDLLKKELNKLGKRLNRLKAIMKIIEKLNYKYD